MQNEKLHKIYDDGMRLSADEVRNVQPTIYYTIRKKADGFDPARNALTDNPARAYAKIENNFYWIMVGRGGRFFDPNGVDADLDNMPKRNPAYESGVHYAKVKKESFFMYLKFLQTGLVGQLSQAERLNKD